MSTQENSVSVEEMILAVSFTQNALVELLEKKGLITKDELLDTIKELQIREQERKARSGN